MNVLITGANGLVGSALAPKLGAAGHNVIPLHRSEARTGSSHPSWCPQRNEINLGTDHQFDAVVHLAGENIGQRWSPDVKRRIRDSRVNGTRLLSETLAKQAVRPKVLVAASATGYYGNRGDEVLDEQSTPGNGFLADLCRDWESATELAARSGIRVVNVRFGVVLGPRGGALRKMLPPFRLGLGGKIGDGQQYWSWIAIDDVVGAIELALATNTLQGPVNVVSPEPVRNVEFTKALAATLHRPALFAVPKFAVKLLMGEMGEEALLCSFRVKPKRLQDLGFRFQFPELTGALQHLLAASR